MEESRLRLETVPQPVLAKLFALQRHADHLADLKSRAPEMVERLRRVINGDSQIGENTREVAANRRQAEAEFHLMGAFDPQRGDPLVSVSRRADAAAIAYSNCRFWLDGLP